MASHKRREDGSASLNPLNRSSRLRANRDQKLVTRMVSMKMEAMSSPLNCFSTSFTTKV